MRQVKIYTLSDPESGDIKYVGKTIPSLKTRYYAHIRDGRIKNDYKACWIKSLKNKGLLPKIEVLEEVKEENWEITETYWINQFKAWGFKLTNLAEGGKGAVGYIQTEEEKKRRSNSLKGHRSWNKGIKFSDEVKEKMRLLKIGKKINRRKGVFFRNKTMNPEILQNFITDYTTTNLTMKELGLKYNYNKLHLHKILKLNNIKPRRVLILGSSKEEQRKKFLNIREEYLNGSTAKELAKKYGYSHENCVTNMLRKSFKN